MPEQFQKKREEGTLAHICAATRFSLAGFWAAFRDEKSFRIICTECLVFFPLSCLCARSWEGWILLILPLFICLIVELLNSAIEKTLDRISLDIHPQAKDAKDMGSTAQFLAQIFLFVVWGSYCMLCL
ncbi:MAG: diacylglycerol kinase [Desulfovibrionaceae bacterium]|nr:diacylglycerol kinase [Desulfovibrionaceae bacterium]